uniref:HpcH/HpaI aldolase/citrate lyase domain-containing protein n=1 Tax=Nelumbo nucifera TaxID=4432 RepID=A0A822XKB3_NELNU|nr:TPA_asm: hypothetical protein HUJ06_019461 [Nelumbo nucifera]
MAAYSACNNSLLFKLEKPSSPSLSFNLTKTTISPFRLFSSSTLSHLSSTRNSRFTKSPLTLKTLNPKPTKSPPTTPATTTSDLSPTVDLIRPKTLKARLAEGETLYGMFLLSFSPTIAEIAGLAGYDFVVVDMEHGHGSISDALPCLHALTAAGTHAILRLPESCPMWAKKALDLGPQGVLFPMIDGPKSAKKAVSYCRFPPAGVRGSAHTVVRASSYGMDLGYLDNYGEELLIMCQVETEEGVKKIEEGPMDLSASLGYLWDPGNKKVRELMRVAEKSVLNLRNKGGTGRAYLAGFAMAHDGPDELRKRGYHMISGAVDIGLFRTAAVEDVRRFKMKGSDDEDENGKDKDDKYWSE